MIIPLRSDTYREHHPIITIVFIALNISAWFYLNFSLDDKEILKSSFLLWRGDGLHPLQWILSSFSHLDFMHLFGNMVFLFAFGMIVEGQIGHLSFALVYLGIGTVVNIIEQTLLLGASPSVSLGASSAISGLMAISLIWNPKNEIEVVGVLYIRPFYFELKVLTFCALYFCFDTIFMFIVPFGTSFLHFLGVVVGFAFGYIYLKKGWVDCEDLDLFSLYFHKKKKVIKKKKVDISEAYATKVDMVPQINEAITKKEVSLAYFLYESNLNCQKREDIKFADFILELYKSNMFDDLIYVMRQTENLEFDKKDYCKVLYANVLCKQKDQPQKALNTLKTVQLNKLDYTQKELYNQITEMCNNVSEHQSLELEDF